MDGGFLSKLKPFVWGENLDISEFEAGWKSFMDEFKICLLYTSPSPRDQRGSRMPSSA